jgi:GDP-L-fucose synthase
MPTNLYGPGDNYDLQSGHVISALIRKFHEAKRSGSGEVTVWGSGAPRREFLHADDMAAACLHLMAFPDREFDALFPKDRAPLINVGVGKDQSIKELAETVNRALGAGAKIVWDRTKPDGTPRKLLDSSRLFATGWRPRIEFEDGIRSVLPDLVAQLAGKSA